MKHYTVKVTLYGIKPEIWRRFSVPADSTFAQFHTALQYAMGWEHLYDHEFRHGKGKYLRDVIAQPNPERFKGADSFQNENDITLKDFIGRTKLPKRFLYLYDYADEWIHEVAIENSFESEETEPKMIEGARACPPEACGGTIEYYELCDGMVSWYEGIWDAEKFDIAEFDFKPKPKKKARRRR